MAHTLTQFAGCDLNVLMRGLEPVCVHCREPILGEDTDDMERIAAGFVHAECRDVLMSLVIEIRPVRSL